MTKDEKIDLLRKQLQATLDVDDDTDTAELYDACREALRDTAPGSVTQPEYYFADADHNPHRNAQILHTGQELANMVETYRTQRNLARDEMADLRASIIKRYQTK